MRIRESTLDEIIEALYSGNEEYRTSGGLALPAEDGYPLPSGKTCHVCASGLIAYHLYYDRFEEVYQETTLPSPVLGELGIPKKLDELIWRLNDSPTEFTFEQIGAVIRILRDAGIINTYQENEE